MRDPKRIKSVLARLEQVWVRCPDLRLGQLLGNAKSGDLYYVEDDELLKSVEALYNQEDKR